MNCVGMIMGRIVPLLLLSAISACGGNGENGHATATVTNTVSANGTSYDLDSSFKVTLVTTLYLDFPYKGDTLRIEATVLPQPGRYDSSIVGVGGFTVGYRYLNSGNISIAVAGTMDLASVTSDKITGSFQLTGTEPGTTIPLSCEGSFAATASP